MLRDKYRLTGICLLSVIIGCSSTPETSYEYRAIHESALRKDMQQMANSLRVLAELYFDTTVTAIEHRDIVKRELKNVERIATEIGGEDVITNYSVINRYMGAFLYDVSVAQSFADRDPPNYVPANRLIKSCMSCHSSF